MNGGPDARVGATATQIALHRLVNFCIGWLGDLSKQGRGLHDLSGLAVTALRDLMVDPGLLNCRHAIGGADAFDGGDWAVHVGQGNLTATDGFAIDMNCAGAASCNAAPEFGAGQADFVAEHPQKRHIIRQIDLMCFTVDRKGRWHGAFLSASARVSDTFNHKCQDVN